MKIYFWREVYFRHESPTHQFQFSNSSHNITDFKYKATSLFILTDLHTGWHMLLTTNELFNFNKSVSSKLQTIWRHLTFNLVNILRPKIHSSYRGGLTDKIPLHNSVKMAVKVSEIKIWDTCFYYFHEYD